MPQLYTFLLLLIKLHSQFVLLISVIYIISKHLPKNLRLSSSKLFLTSTYPKWDRNKKQNFAKANSNLYKRSRVDCDLKDLKIFKYISDSLFILINWHIPPVISLYITVSARHVCIFRKTSIGRSPNFTILSCTLSGEAWLYIKRYSRLPTSSRWTAHHLVHKWRLAADCPFTCVYQSWFYHTASHYLRPKLYYYTWLVKIALGGPRQFDGL
jgi:hypothetical protein